MKKNGEIKVCLVGSSGGHLTHLYMLKPFWKDKNRFWVTFDKEDARSLLEGEKVYVPFGYVWNKKGGRRWEIDPEAAPCVKKVFELALSGRNTTQIAYGMNELQFPTPGLYSG